MNPRCKHGLSLYCSRCSLPHNAARPLIPSAYASPIETGPLSVDDIDDASGPAQDDAISKALAAARSTIADLEDSKLVSDWSPAQTAVYRRVG